MTDVKTSSGVQRFRLPPTFSLLWTLGPAPDSLECPISFSPFLPFGTLENTAGDGGIFLLHKVYGIDVYSNTNVGGLLYPGQPFGYNGL